MTDRDDGGPAFPARPTETLTNGATVTAHPGMSLRDYFAVEAGEEDIRQFQNWRRVEGQSRFPESLPKFTREEARYRFADAMLAARKGGAA